MNERFPYAARAAQLRNRDTYAAAAMAYREWTPEMLQAFARDRKRSR
jgi:hypothetical protein